MALNHYWTSYEFVRQGVGSTFPTVSPYGMAMGWTESQRLPTDTVIRAIVTADVGIRTGGSTGSLAMPADWVSVSTGWVSLGWSNDVDGTYPTPTSVAGSNSLLGVDHLVGRQVMSGAAGAGPSGYFTNGKPAVFEGQRKGTDTGGNIPMVSCAILMHFKDGLGGGLSTSYMDWWFRVWVRVLWGSTST